MREVTQAGRSCSWQAHVCLLLMSACAVLSLLSLVLLRVTPFEVLRDPASPVVQLLDVRAESNLPTWFTVVLLAAAAVAHALVGVLAGSAGAPARPWYAVATLLALLSLDEAAAVHERLEVLGLDLGGGGGALHFAWLLPGAVVGLALLAVTVRLYLLLPRPSGYLVLSGVVVFLAAAFGLEAVGGAVLDGRGDGPLYILVSHLEELVESLATCVLLLAALVAVRVERLPSAVALSFGGRQARPAGDRRPWAAADARPQVRVTRPTVNT
jgi:hypothetical protein